MSKEDIDKAQNFRKRSSETNARAAKSATLNFFPKDEHQDDTCNQFGRNSHKKGKKEAWK